MAPSFSNQVLSVKRTCRNVRSSKTLNSYTPLKGVRLKSSLYVSSKVSGMKRMLAILAIGALLLPIILNLAYAQMITHERTVTLKITDTRNGKVATKEWNLTGYTFGERNIDVSNNMLNKIKKIYNTDSFSFTLQKKTFMGEWLHYKVELIGTPLVGKGLKVKFI